MIRKLFFCLLLIMGLIPLGFSQHIPKTESNRVFKELGLDTLGNEWISTPDFVVLISYFGLSESGRITFIKTYFYSREIRLYIPEVLSGDMSSITQVVFTADELLSGQYMGWMLLDTAGLVNAIRTWQRHLKNVDVIECSCPQLAFSPQMKDSYDILHEYLRNPRFCRLSYLKSFLSVNLDNGIDARLMILMMTDIESYAKEIDMSLDIPTHINHSESPYAEMIGILEEALGCD